MSVLFLPAYFRGELVTSYQLLQQRFGTAVKTLAAGLFLVTRALADGIRLFATALVISIVADVPVSATIVVLGRGHDLVHDARRRRRRDLDRCGADVRVRRRRTDRPGGGVAADPGGWATYARRRRRRTFTCSTGLLDPRRVYTVWSGLIGGIALTLATHGTDQFLVQRLLSARSPRDAALGLILSGVLVFAQFVVFLTIGILLFVYNQQTPLPPPSAALTRSCRASLSPRCRTASSGSSLPPSSLRPSPLR